jgi:DNA-binding NarL/FixJ family response regulator
VRVTIRVFLLDDHEVVRRGVRELLEAGGGDDLVVVGEAGTADEALRRIPAVHPDVAVLDVRLPDGNGVEVCREIRSRHPEVQCLMLTSFADDEALFDSIMAGASGYVLKQVRGADLVASVRQVAAGQSLLDPRVTARVLERLREGPERPAGRGPDQPPDRRADVPGREDGQELRVQPVDQAGHAPAHGGGGLRSPAGGPPARASGLNPGARPVSRPGPVRSGHCRPLLPGRVGFGHAPAPGRRWTLVAAGCRVHAGLGIKRR